MLGPHADARRLSRHVTSAVISGGLDLRVAGAPVGSPTVFSAGPACCAGGYMLGRAPRVILGGAGMACTRGCQYGGYPYRWCVLQQSMSPVILIRCEISLA